MDPDMTTAVQRYYNHHRRRRYCYYYPALESVHLDRVRTAVRQDGVSCADIASSSCSIASRVFHMVAVNLSRKHDVFADISTLPCWRCAVCLSGSEHVRLPPREAYLGTVPRTIRGSVRWF